MTPSEVRERFSYTPTTGVVIHRNKSGRIRAGQPAGTPTHNGYLQTSVGGKMYLNHRVAWCLHHGEWPTGIIDHADRDKRNNRIENLRIATKAQNMHNSGVAKNNTSGVRGVVMKSGKWVAEIKHLGRNIHIGRFDTIEAAAKARRSAEITYWKET